MATCPKCRAHYADDQRHCSLDGETLLPDSAVAHFDAELREGDLVGEYRVEKKVGEGGFGKVYAAVHPVIGKRAAIKVLNREYSSSANVVSRFVSEARAVNQIRHRNIIDIFAFGTLSGGLHYFVMELLEGMTLDAWLAAHGRMPPAQALPVLRAVAKALDAAHGAGIAHRDLKPENVFLCFDDEGGVYPKLLDFGIAKLLGDTQVDHKTRTGAALGTPYYMSPEQCRGKDVDHRTDFYSFGVMIHQLLTGQLPFTGDSAMDVMFKHTHEDPPPMSTFCPELPPALDAPVLEMLKKDAAARPRSATQAIDALISAASTTGMDVPTRSGGVHTAGGSALGASGPSIAAISVDTNSSETAATVSMEPNKAATEMPPSARTLSDDRPPASGSRTWLVAVAALVVGVAVTFALTRRSAEPPPAAAEAQTAASSSAPASEPSIAAPSASIASLVASAPASASSSAAPKPIGSAPKDIKPAPPPPVKPQPDVPDDLEPL